MERISREIYETIQNDIESINKALENIIGSKMMYDELSVKYEIIFPELSKILTKVGGKISFGGEFDFRPELRRIKSALLTKLMVSELEPEINTDIYNSAKVIVNTHLQVADITVNELIEESKLYIRKNSIDEKQIALEKIWDAFERFKTYFGEDKKKSILQILKIVSNGNQSLFEELEKECIKLPKNPTQEQLDKVSQVTMLYEGSTASFASPQKSLDTALDWVVNDLPMAARVLVPDMVPTRGTVQLTKYNVTTKGIGKAVKGTWNTMTSWLSGGAKYA